MREFALCPKVRKVSENNSSMQPSISAAPSGVRGGSLHEFLFLRQICPRKKVIEYPYAGKWTSDEITTESSGGIIEVFRENSSAIPSPPLALSFAKERGNGHLLAVADEDGFVDIYNTAALKSGMTVVPSSRKYTRAHSHRWLAHTNAVFDVCWFKGDAFILTASGDQTIKLWDLERKKAVGVMEGHTGSVKSLCVNPCQSDLLVSGARDGCLAFWDLRIAAVQSSNPSEVLYSPLAKVKDAHKGLISKVCRRQDNIKSVTAVLYLKDDRVVATAGANDGVVKFWDTRKLKAPVAQVPDPKKNGRLHGIAGLSQDPSGTRLIATCVDSTIYMYDTMRPERGALSTFSGHVMGTFYVKAAFSPDGSHILSGSSDYNAYLWKVNEPGSHPTILEGHCQEVTAVSWCPTDFCKIATCSDDYTVRMWNMDQPQFAHRATKDSEISFRPLVSAKEPEAPTSPCAALTSSALQDEQGEAVAPDTNILEDALQMTDAILNVGAKISLSEVTPSSKRVRVLQNSPIGEALHDEAMKDQVESPGTKIGRSPSSVLSPPGSTARRRKTIVDYYGVTNRNPEVNASRID